MSGLLGDAFSAPASGEDPGQARVGGFRGWVAGPPIGRTVVSFISGWGCVPHEEKYRVGGANLTRKGHSLGEFLFRPFPAVLSSPPRAAVVDCNRALVAPEASGNP